MYLMISTYLAPLEKLDEARPAHAAFLDTLGDTVISAGRQDPPVGGVVLLDAATVEEAERIMADDPYVQRGLARYTATGWKPSRGVLAGYVR
ncbi:YciI family protein [Actinoplanes sp. NPDC051633]|uniref:YciI family protein n=1 Tax=Actinoplanes sp. NPDC051633 TaxID=3155670 RepID=UPI003412CBDB